MSPNTNVVKQQQEQHLEEIVFEEVPHGFVGRDGPPGVEIEVEDVEPSDQHQGGQLRLVADSDEDHEQGANKVLDNLEKYRYSTLTLFYNL